LWKLTKVLTSIVLWVLIVVSGAFLMVIGIGPHLFGYHTMTVLSGSMRPGIGVGSMIVVTAESPRDLRAGQIVTYQTPVGDHPVISHRVVKIVRGAGTLHPVFQTKGDANDSVDPWLAQVSSPGVWQVRGSVPNVGRAVSWLRRPAVHTGAVRVVPVLLAVLWLIGIWHSDPEADPDPAGASGAVRSAGS
jgi:signal peptidase